MGFYICYGQCAACARMFAFNPHYVPSTSLFTGSKEPVCSTCMDAINAKRKAHGVEPFAIHPNAYSESDEDEEQL